MRGGARLVAAAAAIAIASCSACGSPEEPAVSSTPGPAPAPPPEQVQPTPPEQEAPPPAEPAVPPVVVFLEAQGDIDGDGTAERLTFDSAGTLRAGQWSTQADLGGIEEEVFRDQASLRVVELDRRRHIRALLLEVPTTETEDPPNRHQFYVLDGDTLRRIHDMTIGSYGAIHLEIPGDGTVRYLEDGWTACIREEAGAGSATRQHVILRVDRRGESIVPSRRTSGPRQDCSQLAACPFVDIIGPDGAAHRVGEILRDLRGEDAYALQSLELAVAAGGPLRFRLVEEKPEVTYLDELYVEVDGQRIEPRACAGAAPPAYCVADHVMHRLHLGDVLEIEVELPHGGAPPLLFARGYYVPTPDR